MPEIDDSIVQFYVPQTQFENMFRVLGNMGNLIT